MDKGNNNIDNGNNISKWTRTSLNKGWKENINKMKIELVAKSGIVVWRTEESEVLFLFHNLIFFNLSRQRIIVDSYVKLSDKNKIKFCIMKKFLLKVKTSMFCEMAIFKLHHFPS